MEPKMSLNIRPYGLASANEIVKAGAATWSGPGLAVDWVEMEGPLNDAWPPVSHERLFAGLKQLPVKVPGQEDHLEVQPNDPAADARRIIAAFARRAFRRPVSDDELAPFIALVAKRQAAGSSFELAMRAGLAGVMTSPAFLFLRRATPCRPC